MTTAIPHTPVTVQRFADTAQPEPRHVFEMARKHGVRMVDFKFTDLPGTWQHVSLSIHGLEEALGLKRPKIPLIVLAGAIAGACIAYSLIYFCNVFDWPLNIGNRPPHGPPANIPITFELAVLLGGGSAFMGFFALSRLPQPYHPVFESEDFARASVDAFFLSVELPAGTDMDRTLADIRASGALSAEIVEESER